MGTPFFVYREGGVDGSAPRDESVLGGNSRVYFAAFHLELAATGTPS